MAAILERSGCLRFKKSFEYQTIQHPNYFLPYIICRFLDCVLVSKFLGPSLRFWGILFKYLLMATEIIQDQNIYRFLEWPCAWSVHVHLGYCRPKELQEVWTRLLGEPCNLDLSNRRSGSVESWRPILTDENTVGIWILIVWILETLEYWTFWSSHFKSCSNGHLFWLINFICLILNLQRPFLASSST